MRLPPLSLVRRKLVTSSLSACLGCFFLIGSTALSGQELSPSQKQTVQKALEFLNKQDFIGGRPLFDQLIKEFTGKPAFASYLDDLHFYLARSYYEELKKNPSSKEIANQAIEKFKEYESKFPQGKNIHYSLMSRVDIDLIINDRKGAIETLDLLLSPKYNSTIPTASLRQEAKYKFTRLCYELEDWARGIPQFQRMISENPGDIDNRSTMSMYLAVGHMKSVIADAEKANKDKPTIKSDRATKMMSAVTAAIGQIDLHSIARNDLYFNGVLFNTAELLYRSELFVEASYFYYQTQTPDILTKFFKPVLQERKDELAALLASQQNSPKKGELEDRVKEIEARIDEIKKIKNDYTPYLKFRKADCLRLLNRFYEAHFAFLDLSTEFKKGGPAELKPEDLWWQSFDMAFKAEMVNKALTMGEKYLTKTDWPKPKYEREVMLKLIEINEEIGKTQKVLALADQFIKNFTGDRYSKLMVFKIGNTMVKSVQYDELKVQMDGYLSSLKDKTGFKEVEDGFLYWRGISNVLLQDFEVALPDFSKVVVDFATARGGKPSDYWEDSQFREAICLYGLQEMKEAEAKLRFYIEKFPDSNNRGEAHLYLGDLFSGKGKVDDAISNYRQAIDFTVKKEGSQTFIDHSTFQIGRMQEQARRYADMQKTYEEYLSRFSKDADADLSNAVFNLGKAFEGLNQPDKMLSAYLGAITTYGDNPRAFGVDNILLAIQERYVSTKEYLDDNLAFLKYITSDANERKKFFSSTPEGDELRNGIQKKFARLDSTFRINCRKEDFRKKCLESDAFLEDQFLAFNTIQKNMPSQTPEQKFAEIYAQSKAKDKQTLALRMLMAADKATGKALATFNFSEADLAFASPATLVWISQKTSDKNLITMALKTVLTKYRDSDFGFDALIQQGLNYEKVGDLFKARESYKLAGDTYPTHPSSFLSYIREGDVLTAMSKFDEARKMYEDVLRNPAWKRIDAAVEAKYKLGVLLMRQNKYEESANAFQRIYISHPTSIWAPKAYQGAAGSFASLGDAVREKQVTEEYLKNEVARAKDRTIETEFLQRSKK